MLLFLVIMLDGGIDMSANFDSFESCSHLLKCDCHFLQVNETFSHQADLLDEPVMCRICNPGVTGSIPGWVDAVQRLWAS